MVKKAAGTIFFSLLFFLSSAISPPYSLCQQPHSLQKGIDQYKKENYEEAIEALTKARSEDPGSSVAAFFLGLAYKQTMDYEKALENLRDAVTLTPRIKEALVELVDVAMQVGKIEEAKKWIKVAEEENISPAKIAFLKGLVLREEGKNKEAAEAFEKAKSIDPTISQAADIQVAISYLRQRELKKAKERFQTAILYDPQSDLAGFARQYLKTVEERLFAERPFHFTLGLFPQYDSNMVLQPTDESLVTGITNQASGVLNSYFRVIYTPALKGPWLLNAQYSLYSSLHQKNVHTHDSISNTISVTPGYNFGRYSLNLATTYTHSLVRGPSYKKYSGSFSSGPMLRIALKENQLLELFAGYNSNEYFQPALTAADDRDSDGPGASLSWIWLFKKDSFFNLKYQYWDLDADGVNWDNRGHRFSANVAMPLIEKVILQLSGQVNIERYKNINTWFNVGRKDTTYTLSGGLTRDLSKNMNLVVQYTRIRNHSNIGIYDYTRDLYTAGLEYRF